jgi:type II secretory pathway pseudopilin PulG
MRHRRTARRRGYLLIELMAILGIIALTALIAIDLYLNMSQNHIRLIGQQEAQQRFDLAVRQLRSDVWNVSAASIDDKGLLQLTRTDGKKIQWRAGDRLNRTSDGLSPEEWNRLGTQLSFEMHGPTVVLREDPSQADPTSGEIVMPMVAAGFKGDSR